MPATLIKITADRAIKINNKYSKKVVWIPITEANSESNKYAFKYWNKDTKVNTIIIVKINIKIKSGILTAKISPNKYVDISGGYPGESPIKIIPSAFQRPK